MTGNTPETEIKQDEPGLSVPLDEVEIELEGGDQSPPEGQAPEPDAQQKPDTGDGPPKRKKPRIDAARRIGQLTAVNAQTAAEKAELERELAALRGDADHRGDMALFYARKGLESDLKLAERELADVKRDGTDATAEAALTTRIAGIQAQLQTIPQVERPQARAPEPERQPQQTRRPQGPAPLPEAEPGTPRGDWESRNPWFTPSSPDFDAELHQEARIYAANLERRLIREGRQAEIDGPAYYQAISRYMDTEFFEQEPEPAQAPRNPTRLPQMTNTRSPVAAPSRGAQQPNGNSVVKLGADQQDMALRFFGNKKHPDGRAYSKEDAMKHYAWHQKNPNASMIPITMKTSRG